MLSQIRRSLVTKVDLHKIQIPRYPSTTDVLDSKSQPPPLPHSSKPPTHHNTINTSNTKDKEKKKSGKTAERKAAAGKSSRATATHLSEGNNNSNPSPNRRITVPASPSPSLSSLTPATTGSGRNLLSKSPQPSDSPGERSSSRRSSSSGEIVMYRFVVMDSGCGISPEFKEKIFAPFQQVLSLLLVTAAGDSHSSSSSL